MKVGVSGEIGDIVKFVGRNSGKEYYYGMITRVYEDLSLGYNVSGLNDNFLHIMVPGADLEYIYS